MPKMTIGEKAERVLRFFLGLRNPRIVAALTAHGFTAEDLAEGWQLLRAVTGTKLDQLPVAASTSDPVALTLLDEWENKWFPIAAATLQRRAPEVNAWVFRNLAQTEGDAVIVSVGTFLERFKLLGKAKKDDGYGIGGPEAKKLLEKRGLTPKVIGEAEALLERLQTTAPASEVEAAPAAEEDDAYAKAEAELWAWYLEWSVIARRVVKNRSYLRQLGFLKAGPDGKEVLVEEETPDAKPAKGDASTKVG